MYSADLHGALIASTRVGASGGGQCPEVRIETVRIGRNASRRYASRRNASGGRLNSLRRMVRTNFGASAIVRRLAALGVAAAALVAGCSGSGDVSTDAAIDDAAIETVETIATIEAGTAAREGDDARDPGWAGDVYAAIDAVEAELGTGQRFFEVTANRRFTNVFVATDDASAAIPYTFVDGTLQPPAPTQSGAEGATFERSDVRFDPDLVLAGIRRESPDSDPDAISVYGDGVGATYVVAVSSRSGGFLDVVVGADGQVFSVAPA